VSALYPNLLLHGDYYSRVAMTKTCTLSGLEIHSSELQKVAEVISEVLLATSEISEGQGICLSME